VLAPDAKPDQPRRNATEQRYPVEQAEHEGNLVQLGLAHHQRRQHAVMDDLLCALDDPRRE